MTGPGDKLKAFMRKFIGPKSQQAYRQVQHSVSGKGDVRGVKKRKLMQGLTGDPVKDNEILYGPTPESKFNRPLTVDDQRPRKNGHPKITDDPETYAKKLKKIQQSTVPTSDTARITPTPKHNKILSQFEGPQKKGELVQYQRKDGSIVITTKRKAKKYKRKEDRQEKKNKKINTRQTPDAKF